MSCHGYLSLALSSCTQRPHLLFPVSPPALSNAAPAPGAFWRRESFFGPHWGRSRHQGRCTCPAKSAAACWQLDGAVKSWPSSWREREMGMLSCRPAASWVILVYSLMSLEARLPRLLYPNTPLIHTHALFLVKQISCPLCFCTVESCTVTQNPVSFLSWTHTFPRPTKISALCWDVTI